MGVITRHFVYALLLWYCDDNWHVTCESNNNEENIASEPTVSIEPDYRDGSVDASMIIAAQPSPSSPRIIHSAPVAIDAVSPSYKARLASPGAVDTSNFKTPTAVYAAIPIVTFVVGFCAIYAYCSWKKNMLKNRNKKLDKVAERRRRVSLKPGSPAAETRALKYGLYARSQKSEHDPAALITFSAAITGLATELEMVDHMVLDYKSINSGEAIPEFHKLDIENEAYSVTINPLFNSLQSGACGYVLSSVKNPLLRFTDERRTSVPLRLENSAYIAPAPSPPPPEGQGDETEDEEAETEYGEDETSEGQEGVTSGSEENSTATTTTIGSPSIDEQSTSETDTSEKGKHPGEASSSRAPR